MSIFTKLLVILEALYSPSSLMMRLQLAAETAGKGSLIGQDACCSVAFAFVPAIFVLFRRTRAFSRSETEILRLCGMAAS